MAFRVLVIRLSSLGDVIHALPAVASLKHTFPQGHLSWVIKPRWAPLLAGNPFVDEIIPYERTTTGILALRSRLKQERFDVVVDLQGLIQSALIAAAARSDKKVGFARTQAREAPAALFYSTGVRTTSVHRVDQYIELACAAGASRIVRSFPIPEGRAEGSLPAGRFVLACPFAGWGAKQWPVDNYSELARALAARNLRLVVNGPPASAGALALIQDAEIHLSGLDGLIDATRRASAVVGIDSGPMHLAAALSKPGVAIYGPTDPASHGPYGGSIPVLRDPNAVTSYKRLDAPDPSMSAIPGEAVVDALSWLWDSSAATARRQA
jgi:heptosyltransferase I